jgi:hypothetical protein
MNPTASASPWCVSRPVSSRAFTSPNGTQGHHGLLLCDTAAYRDRCRTRTSCQFSNFGGNNQKRRPACRVTMEYRGVDAVFTPGDFPTPSARPPRGIWPTIPRASGQGEAPVRERARRYLATVPPASTGQHGDLHTFRVCCRLVRGFALADHEALAVLADWNARCEPPWNERDLIAKLRHALRYGREPIGGLMERRR